MELHLASFNAENFYLLLDRPLSRDELEALDPEVYQAMNSSIYNPNKERGKIAEIARIILEQDFDFVGLCEVGGMETLRAFNRLYLQGKYECCLHEENSRRGIYVGALVRKGRFPFLRARNAGGDFSRNLLKVELGGEGETLTVFVVHLKSQYGQDRGLEQRIREIKALCTLVPRRRCVIMGDFNGLVMRKDHQFEYAPILALPFRDVLEAVGIPEEKRRTHYYFGGGEVHFTQLDYIFCSLDLDVRAAGVLEGEIPLNRQQREFLPSDHLFIQARVSTGGEDRSPRTGEKSEAGKEVSQTLRDSPAPDKIPGLVILKGFLTRVWNRFFPQGKE